MNHPESRWLPKFKPLWNLMHPRATSQPKELHYGLENSEKAIIFHHLVLQEKPCPCVAVGPGYFLLFETQTKSLYKLTGQYQVKNYKNSEINATMAPQRPWNTSWLDLSHVSEKSLALAAWSCIAQQLLLFLLHHCFHVAVGHNLRFLADCSYRKHGNCIK